jgi:primosomal protein N' (replication factor Y)
LGQAQQAVVELLGPVPAPMERRVSYYRAQLLVQAGQR